METDSTFWLETFGIAILLLVAGIASAMDAAVSTLGRVRLKFLSEQNRRNARALAWLATHPRAAQIGLPLLQTGLLTAVLLWAFSLDAAEVQSGRGGPAFLAGAILILSMLVLVIAFSRALGTRVPERVASAFAGVGVGILLLLNPVTGTVMRVTDTLVGMLRGRGGSSDAPQGEPDVALLEEIPELTNAVEKDERAMILRIMDMGETAVRSVMVPRVDIIGVEVDTDLGSAADVVIERGYSRLPVYEGSIDNVIGVVYAKDLLSTLRRNGGRLPSLRELARPASFVPESKRVGELFHDMQQQRVHLAIVVDEYGGTAGLVTIEDLLEEIVGEIEDEYHTSEPQAQWTGDGEAVVDGRLSIHDLNEMFASDISGEEFESVGGFLYARLGRIPTAGDTVAEDHLTFTLLSTQGRRVKAVRVVSAAAPTASHQVDQDASDRRSA